MFRRPYWLIVPCSLVLIVSGIGCPGEQWPAPRQAPRPGTHRMYELKLAGAVLMSHGKQTTPALLKDTFGPGMDGTNLSGGKDRPDELRYACSGLPEGDYCVGLPVLSPNRSYFGVGEEVSYQLEIHHNDDRQAWTGYTQPLRPENAAEKVSYQSELRLDNPVHLKPSDVFRLVWWCDTTLVVGPLRLYNYKPAGAVATCAPPCNGTRSRFLYADWGDADRSPQSITQSCTLTNPGVLPHTYQVTVQRGTTSWLRSWPGRPKAWFSSPANGSRAPTSSRPAPPDRTA